jgi:hypothetical protein
MGQSNITSLHMGKKYNLVLSEKMVATLPATPETTVKKKAGMLV